MFIVGIKFYQILKELKYNTNSTLYGTLESLSGILDKLLKNDGPTVFNTRSLLSTFKPITFYLESKNYSPSMVNGKFKMY